MSLASRYAKPLSNWRKNGLIQIRPQRGSYVNKNLDDPVRNGCFVRQAIECAVVRRAGSMINDEQLYQLEQKPQPAAGGGRASAAQ